MNCLSCRKCSTNLIIGSNFLASDLKYGIYLCKKCKALDAYTYKINNKALLASKKVDKIKANIEYLGGACKCCSTDIWRFLTIDHINNDGATERRQGNNIRLDNLHQFNETQLVNLQLLCMNCNYSKGHNGFCFHNIISDFDFCKFCKTALDKNNTLNLNSTYKICNSCLIENSVKLKSNYDFKNKLRKRKEILNLKQKVITAYGGECECCGENNQPFLNIDHINGGGRKENKELKKFGCEFYRWLKKNNFPKDNYRLLCYNCNCSAKINGKCYHQICIDENKIISIEDYKLILHQN